MLLNLNLKFWSPILLHAEPNRIRIGVEMWARARRPAAAAALLLHLVPGAAGAGAGALAGVASWSATPVRPTLAGAGGQRTVIKNPRRGQRVEPEGGGLLEEVARWDAEEGSGENDLDLLLAMSTNRPAGDDAPARPAGSTPERQHAPGAAARLGLRAIARAEARLQRSLRVPPERAGDGLEGLTPDELQSLAGMAPGGQGGAKEAGAGGAEHADAVGSEVSSAHAGDAPPPPPPAKPPSEMLRVEMLARENSFLRMQLEQLSRQGQGRHGYGHRSSDADESQEESRNSEHEHQHRNPPLGSDHAMQMMDEQLRRLPERHPSARSPGDERAHKRRRPDPVPAWLPPAPAPAVTTPAGGLGACADGLRDLLARRSRDRRIAVIPGVGVYGRANTALHAALSVACPAHALLRVACFVRLTNRAPCRTDANLPQETCGAQPRLRPSDSKRRCSAKPSYAHGWLSKTLPWLRSATCDQVSLRRCTALPPPRKRSYPPFALPAIAHAFAQHREACRLPLRRPGCVCDGLRLRWCPCACVGRVCAVADVRMHSGGRHVRSLPAALATRRELKRLRKPQAYLSCSEDTLGYGCWRHSPR